MNFTNAQRSGGDKGSLYQEVTDRIISELEKGSFPWVQPWGAAKAGLGLPKNAATARRYSGINILILWGAVIEKGFRGQNWLTFRQALTLGGSVRKGEKGTTVCYADRFIPKGEVERAAKTGDDPNAVPFLKRFTVFNVDQCDGLPATAFEGIAPLPDRDTIPHAESLIAATGADFRIGGARAFYQTADDFIQVPPQPAFFQQIDYYRTCFHELGHWTGAKHRLARDHSGRFGSHPYAREELVAEMTSAFVCAALGITPTVRHTDYLANWLEVLKEDKLGEARAINAAPESYKPTDAQVAWYLGRFITNVRSLSTDPVVVRQNWLQAYDFATDHGAAVLNEYARSNDPFANVGAQTVSVQVTSVVKAPGSTYQVRWTEQTYKQGNLDKTSHWTAMVTVVTQTPRTADALRKNPLGIYVNGLDWSEELNAAK